MKNITREDDGNRYYLHEGYFIVWDKKTRVYSTYLDDGKCLTAGTQAEMVVLIEEQISEQYLPF